MLEIIKALLKLLMWWLERQPKDTVVDYTLARRQVTRKLKNGFNRAVREKKTSEISKTLLSLSDDIDALRRLQSEGLARPESTSPTAS